MKLNLTGSSAPWWQVSVPFACDTFSCQAHTKGEARALAKKLFGIKGRLPVGAKVERKPLAQPPPGPVSSLG